MQGSQALAIDRSLFRIVLGKVVREVDVIVRTRRREPEVWLVPDFVVVCVLDVFFDRLLLVEDADGLDGPALVVPPAAFFGSSVTLVGFVDRDRGWLFTFPLFVDVVAVDCTPEFPGAWVGCLEPAEIRHDASSVMMSEMTARRMRMMSPSSHACCHGLIFLVGMVQS